MSASGWMRGWSRAAITAVALTGVLTLGMSAADARVGSGSSSGSRGSKTYTAPPATNTAPKATQPVERSMTQPGAGPVTTVNRAGSPAGAAAATQSRFGGGFGGMLMGGLLGAGLFGLLSGNGLFGGLGGLASMLGLLVQMALIGGLVYLAFAFFRSRSQPAMAGANGAAPMMARQGLAPGQRASTAAGTFSRSGNGIAIVKDDYDVFQDLLVRIQDAYGREDMPTLRRVATPEMVSYLAEDIAANSSKGLRNVVSDAKLLQGDLSEAWRDTDAEFATVAMRYTLIDTMVDRASGRIVEGNKDVPQEVTEIWTFRRAPGSDANGWKLSAIQQAA